MMENVIITAATVVDAQAIWELQQLAYQQEARRYNDFSLAPLCESLAELRGLSPRFTFLQAVYDGQIIGSVRTEQRELTCSIVRLMVHPTYQRRGIGSALMAAVEACHVARPVSRSSPERLSVNNIRLYRHLGYSEFAVKDVSPNLSLVYLEKRCCAE